jgi:hypothetical protein
MATAEKPPFDDATKPPAASLEADGAPDVVPIRFGAWLRSMLAIAACVFRHPFSTTYVDLSTGETSQSGD